MKRLIATVLLTGAVISCWFVLTQSQSAAQKPDRRVIKLPAVPAPSVPISPAVVAGDFVFTSGTLGIDPKTGQMAGPDFEEQAEQVLVNLTAVLEAAGSNTSRVVKTTVFLADMNDYQAMNEVYRRHFKQDPPARSAIQVAKLPANARIEIEAVALLK
jgi:2-iminobutanoate/2-iminopropanoate deaminase